MVPVPLRHPRGPLREAVRVRRVGGELAHRLHAVHFHVGLVADVQAVPVAEAVELGGIGVVAGADGVEVVEL